MVRVDKLPQRVPRVTMYKPTRDNWCGSYSVKEMSWHPDFEAVGNNLVRVSVVDYGPATYSDTGVQLSAGGYGIVASGSDDLMLSRQFEQEGAMWQEYAVLAMLESIEIDALVSRGFAD